MAGDACQKNWLKEALDDAIETIDYFEDTVVEQLSEKGEASEDLYNDYPNGDQYHHESHTDKSYSLIDAAHLLDQLSDHEETDSGLWEGIEDPERALEVKAAFTYGNAVMSEFQDLIKELNEEFQDFSPQRRGPKEWSPRGRKGPASIKEFVQKFLKERREKL